MDSSIVTALAALLGSLIGGFTSFATTWLSQKHTAKSQWLRDEVSKREALYSAFIDEAARRLADAVENNINSPGQVVNFYALFNRIRFVGTDDVARTAEGVMEVVINLYNAPNTTLNDIFQPKDTRDPDPLAQFTGACRLELQSLKRAIG